MSPAGRNAPTNGQAKNAELNRTALIRDLEGIGRKDGKALARLYVSTSPKLNALLIRMLGDPSEAEDVLQEVYLAVWRRAVVFDPARASPTTWLVTIARNRAIDRIRANRAARRTAAAGWLEQQQPLQPETVLETMEKAEEGRHLQTCLETLDSYPRAAIRAAFFEGLTYEELAQRQGVPLGTMKSRIRRGLISLRKCLTDIRSG